MKKLALLIALLPLSIYAQTTPPASAPNTVTISARGNDVNGVLVDLFTQAKKQFVIQPNIHFALFLSLKDAPYDRALRIVCDQANLTATLEDGIIYIRKAPAKPVTPFAQPKPPAPAKVRLPANVLERKLTVRMKKADLKMVFDELGKNTEVPIEVDSSVPAVKVDAFLIQTSLKYALDKVTRATGLEYAFTDRGTILVKKS